ncbi:TetR/AcrR family transcriptional regulator [Leifsonia sp. Root112D2]|uniref:TetR/AcrR family transcriptional regulator n=1 Tax=Leifsonia sp. Root112D2 TaxID=1736426 RepID=UPI0006FE6348|nr:TetR/AcrR family transcriptional regulator [Leifsonia sp. Root112D2]KQV05286.1 TetR family transcriptional regulator [Leifsonia sp. Root112D2]
MTTSAETGTTEGAVPTQRSRAKADRRRALLDAAAALFAQRGFNGVSIEDLGAAAGVSGPAVYRHFSGKQDVLAALLVEVSHDLLDGGADVVSNADGDDDALRALIRFHVSFALARTDVIRVQDRDLDSLAEAPRREVRTLQRDYIELWISVLARLHPAPGRAELRMRVQATFGLINSTPHSVGVRDRTIDDATSRRVLELMAWSGLNA